VSSLIDHLRQIVGQQNLLTTDADVTPYSFDGTPVLRQRAACVVFPTSTEQVADILRVAAQEEVSVVTRGSGTGLSGGSVPVEGCVVLCLVQMNRILELDTRNLTIRVEPGVITQKLTKRRPR
jgi:glycolate oxidase